MVAVISRNSAAAAKAKLQSELKAESDALSSSGEAITAMGQKARALNASN